MDLQGKVAFVTGGARGIGAAVAKGLVAQGAAVAIADLLDEAGERTASELRAAGGQAQYIHCDVTQPDQVAQALDRTATHHKRLDILVNNAGISYPADFPTNDFAHWHRAVEVILHGSFHCANHAAKLMIQQGRGGRIVNISSVHQLVAERGTTHYDTAKGALGALCRAMAVDLAPHGILVNNVAPGFVETDMALVNGQSELETDWFRTVYVENRRIPLARAARPEEIAEVVLFLCSPRNTYMTGATLVADGGLTVTF